MTTLSESELDEISRAVEQDFPYDPALQQVHIARKIIAREAEREGLSYFDYVKREVQRIKRSKEVSTEKADK
jgi:hypothetical protein